MRLSESFPGKRKPAFGGGALNGVPIALWNPTPHFQNTPVRGVLQADVAREVLCGRPQRDDVRN